MLFLALQRVILEKCQKYERLLTILAGFHAIYTCQPVKAGYQVDIEIYIDKLSKSGYSFLPSHIQT